MSVSPEENEGRDQGEEGGWEGHWNGRVGAGGGGGGDGGGGGGGAVGGEGLRRQQDKAFSPPALSPRIKSLTASCLSQSPQIAPTSITQLLISEV